MRDEFHATNIYEALLSAGAVPELADVSVLLALVEETHIKQRNRGSRMKENSRVYLGRMNRGA